MNPTLSNIYPHLSHMNPLLQIVLGFLAGAGVAFLAYRARALDRSGAAAAALTGGVIFGYGGWPWAVLLLAFFVSSSGLSKAFAARKAGLSEKFSKGSRRDSGQVLANGGLAALLALLHAFWPQAAWPWIAFVGAMAAVNADTWATELGVLNPTPPRQITTLRLTERGESGAISLWGSLAALAGAGLIALLGGLVSPWAGAPLDQVSLWSLILAGGLGGVAGSFFDSFLGATVQAIYWCPACQKETERHPTHLCGAATTRRRGWRWLDNDWVNLSASLIGAGAALCLAWFL